MGKRFYAKCWLLTLLGGFFSALAFTSFLNVKHLTLLVCLFSPFPFQKSAPTKLVLWDLVGSTLNRVQQRELLDVANAIGVR